MTFAFRMRLCPSRRLSLNLHRSAQVALLGLTGLWATAGHAGGTLTLAERMQLFHDGTLKGIALAELPQDGHEIYTEADYQDLAETGASVVRVPVQLRKCAGCAHYDTPDADILYAERVLERGERYGFRVVVVLLATPWGNESDYWGNDSLKADMVVKWREVAQRLKSYPALQAYDLINEPVVRHALPGQNPQAHWHELAAAMVGELRAADRETPLMIEPAPWGLPSSLSTTQAFTESGLVYSFHFYEPHAFTHQGLPGEPGPMTYPGQGGNRERLSRAVDDARHFAAAHRVPMFVGEFSCVRWAPEGSCPRYIADSLALFEAERWGWAYHCWRCYQGWDAEIPESVARDTPVEQMPQHRRGDSPTVGLLRRAMSRRTTASKNPGWPDAARP